MRRSGERISHYVLNAGLLIYAVLLIYTELLIYKEGMTAKGSVERVEIKEVRISFAGKRKK